MCVEEVVETRKQGPRGNEDMVAGTIPLGMPCHLKNMKYMVTCCHELCDYHQFCCCTLASILF